jgi:predicted MFS family arabinose efflux permease
MNAPTNGRSDVSAQRNERLPGVAAGAALIPFSLLGFGAGKSVPRLIARITERWTYAFSVVIAVASALLFAAADQSLLAVLAAIALLGFAVGGVFAVMPKLVLVDVPQDETASVLSINQIARSIGLSIGSALAGFLLAASALIVATNRSPRRPTQPSTTSTRDN